MEKLVNMSEESRILLAAFEGDAVAPGLHTVEFHSVGESSVDSSDRKRTVVTYYRTILGGVSVIVLPSFGNMSDELQQRLYSTMAMVSYEDLEHIKIGIEMDSGDQYYSNFNKGITESFTNVLNKNFKHKNIQLLLALTMIDNDFAYPDWFVDLAWDKEDELVEQFVEICKEYDKTSSAVAFNGLGSSPETKLIGKCRALFGRTEYETAYVTKESKRNNAFDSRINFEVANLVQTWLFNGDVSMTFGDAIDKGFSLAKADPRMVTPENVELAWVFADKLISVLFEGNPNEDFFTIPDNVDMLELLKSDKVVQEKWSRVFNLTVFEALSIHSNVLADEEVLKIFGRARKVTLNSTLLLWRDSLADNSKAYGKKSVKTVLDKYTDEMFMNFGEEHFGLTLDQVDLLIEWDAYCSANDYIPWHFYKMLNTEAETMEVAKTLTF